MSVKPTNQCTTQHTVPRCCPSLLSPGPGPQAQQQRGGRKGGQQARHGGMLSAPGSATPVITQGTSFNHSHTRQQWCLAHHCKLKSGRTPRAQAGTLANGHKHPAWPASPHVPSHTPHSATLPPAGVGWTPASPLAHAGFPGAGCGAGLVFGSSAAALLYGDQCVRLCIHLLQPELPSKPGPARLRCPHSARRMNQISLRR